MMAHKTGGFILGSFLAITATINSFATLSDAEKAFYKEHQNAFNAAIFDKVQRGLRQLNENIDYWWMKSSPAQSTHRPLCL